MLRGHARPSRALRAHIGKLYGSNMELAVDSLLSDTEAIDTFAGLLTQSIERNQAKDGRIDMRMVAADIIAEMRRNQK